MSEGVFQSRLFGLLRVNGFRLVLEDGTLLDLFFHVFDSRKTVGAGFPDVLAIHPKRLEVWFIELKKNGEYLKPKQKVLRAVEKATGGRVKYRVWRPRDFDAMVEELGGRDSRLFA